MTVSVNQHESNMSGSCRHFPLSSGIVFVFGVDSKRQKGGDRLKQTPAFPLNVCLYCGEKLWSEFVGFGLLIRKGRNNRGEATAHEP